MDSDKSVRQPFGEIINSSVYSRELRTKTSLSYCKPCSVRYLEDQTYCLAYDVLFVDLYIKRYQNWHIFIPNNVCSPSENGQDFPKKKSALYLDIVQISSVRWRFIADNSRRTTMHAHAVWFELHQGLQWLYVHSTWLKYGLEGILFCEATMHFNVYTLEACSRQPYESALPALFGLSAMWKLNLGLVTRSIMSLFCRDLSEIKSYGVKFFKLNSKTALFNLPPKHKHNKITHSSVNSALLIINSIQASSNWNYDGSERQSSIINLELSLSVGFLMSSLFSRTYVCKNSSISSESMGWVYEWIFHAVNFNNALILN